MNRKLRMGMIGGGIGAFIGNVHRIAAQMDGKIELVCGAFSSTPEKSKESGKQLLLPNNRVYGSYKEMFQKEAKLPADQRMDFVTIVTPNNVHYDAAMSALSAGFHVVCDKPMTMTLAEAKRLQTKVKQTKQLFCLTHNYTGYPMVKEARSLVRGGQMGRVRKVVVEYPQGWLADRIERNNRQKQAIWRTDPKKAGSSCCMGDIGSHCENLAEYVTGLNISELCSDLTTFVKGRILDDDGSVLLRMQGGAKGILWASQIAVGQENSLNIRVYCEKGTIEWHQEEPNTLIVRWAHKAPEMRRTSTAFVGKAATNNVRTPAGHPEGFLEAFGNIYKAFAQTLEKKLNGKKVDESKADYPTVTSGVRGMAFLEAVVKSNTSKNKWVRVSK
ncbi:MAG: Gfo/Idh/MocA family oxidoreductase [Lentisphaerae bacterium]|nr:Gfo/Idh/MocA family oxidoreductase [Lentisphaerota bacterium]